MDSKILAELNARRDEKRKTPAVRKQKRIAAEPLPKRKFLDAFVKAEDCLDLPDAVIAQLGKPLQRKIKQLKSTT